MKVGVARMPGRPLLALRLRCRRQLMRYTPLGSMRIHHIPKYSKFKEAYTSKMAGQAAPVSAKGAAATYRKQGHQGTLLEEV